MISSRLYPETIFCQQKSCAISVQFNDETGNVCTCLSAPSLPMSPCQANYFKFYLVLLDNSTSNDENLYDDDLDEGETEPFSNTPAIAINFTRKQGTFFRKNNTKLSLGFISRVAVLCCSHSNALLHG